MCNFCSTLQIQEFQLKKKCKSLSSTFSDPFKNLKGQKKYIGKRVKILLGNDRTVDSINEAVDKLAERNYPQLFNENFDPKNGLKLYIPEFFLTKVPTYVEPSRVSMMTKNLKSLTLMTNTLFGRTSDQEIKFLRSQKKGYEGELTEIHLYESLKNYFDERQETVCVFFGYDLLKFDLGNNTTERDCLIINLTKAYIMAFEAKKTLGKGTSASKACEQLETNKIDLESWFEGEISKPWRFIPFIYCSKIEAGIDPCGTCKKFIISGKFLHSDF